MLSECLDERPLPIRPAPMDRSGRDVQPQTGRAALSGLRVGEGEAIALWPEDVAEASAKGIIGGSEGDGAFDG